VEHGLYLAGHPGVSSPLDSAPHKGTGNRISPRPERRTSRRARVPGLYVTYETSAGKRIEADVLDVAAGGIFIRALSPITAGKRLSLEIRLAGSASPWPAVADVVWTRGIGPAGPAGMGVKLVEADDAVKAAIDRLVATRERAVPRPGPRVRERANTLLGVGSTEAPSEPPASEARPASVAPGPEAAAAPEAPAAAPEASTAREPPATTQATEAPQPEPPAPAVEATPAAPVAASAPAPEADQSLAVDLVVRKAIPAEPPSEASMAAAGIPVRRRRWPLVVLLLVAVAATAVYVERRRIPWAHLRSLVGAYVPGAPASLG
jgi:uncharacterized protein (TIGR02266 family)